ncbi:MAG: FG-GAP-like repeat-containing protein [Isosphaeraceae bacterium]
MSTRLDRRPPTGYDGTTGEASAFSKRDVASRGEKAREGQSTLAAAEVGQAGRSRGWTLAAIGVLALGLIVLAGGWWVQKQRTEHLRTLLVEARAEVDAGRFNLAREKLDTLAASQPGWDEVLYLQGLCEQGRGRLEAALDAWSRVPPGSSFAVSAAVKSARAELARGRMAEAERRVIRYANLPGSDAVEARRTLLLLLKFQDRRQDIRRILQNTIGPPDSARADAAEVVDVIRQLWSLEYDPFPVASVQSYLNGLTRLAPADDRVRLGLARLDVRAGRFDDAAEKFDTCLKQNPDDPAVWRARLDWALSATRPEVALACLPHVVIPDDPTARRDAEVEASSLRAWFAARRGDRGEEAKALDRHLAAAPADLPALERRAELEALAGKPEAAGQLRRRKDELDRLRSDYARLLGGDDPRAHAAELAALAQRLGRSFEADWWNRLAGGKPAAPSSTAPIATTLAALLPELTRHDPRLPIDERSIENPSTPATVRFVDDAAKAGLVFSFDQGRSAQRQLPETMSGGIGLLDVDGDGLLDVYAVQGGSFPPASDKAPAGDRLFRNMGKGTFEDITERSGIAGLVHGYGHGVAVGDVDNDGKPDLFLTRWRSYALLRNLGGGRFEDATERWGLGGDRDWPTSAGFADLDNDGDLDLYVCHYLAWDSANPRLCKKPENGEAFYCTPADFPALPDHVFRNDGGKFVDVSEASGIRAADANGRGLGVLLTDLDDDGNVDIYVANDMSSNYLFHNLGGFRFEEIGLVAGVATSGNGGNLAGMGIACGDVDRDTRPDLVVTNFFGESSTYYRNLGDGFFADQSSIRGIAALTRDLLGFGVALADMNNDGYLDLLSANGHVNDGRPQFPWMMPLQLLLASSEGRFRDAGPAAGDPFLPEHLGRGLAVGDLDNDGRLDALALVQGEPLVYLHNLTERTPAQHAVSLLLEGRGSNRDGVGARVTLRTGSTMQTAWRFGGGSFLTAADPRLHFGLGARDQIDAVEVRWPSGRTEAFRKLAVDAVHRLREGSGQPLGR